MPNKLNDKASGPSEPKSIKRKLPLSPSCSNTTSKPCLEKWFEDWEILSRHGPTKNEGDGGENNKSDRSASVAGHFNGGGYLPSKWDRSPFLAIEDRSTYGLEYRAAVTEKEKAKPLGQQPQQTPRAFTCNEKNDSKGTPVDSGPNRNPHLAKDASLNMQASHEGSESESLFWIGGHVKMLIAERRELFERIEKLEKVVEAQAATSKRMDDLQKRIDEVAQAAQTKDYRLRYKKKLEDKLQYLEEGELQYLEEDASFLAEELDYAEETYAALQKDIADLSDDFSSLKAMIVSITKRLEQRKSERCEDQELDDMFLEALTRQRTDLAKQWRRSAGLLGWF
ncbi:hypothetical protein F5Y05DRAFT_418587 [Hypoxylon sp. FL0543]|nr:hypothetical protein F5Y05DRAFT_418587 [Hypoxylon sp. FL0543]